MNHPNRTARRATWTAVASGLALVGALAFSPVLAQDAATDSAGATTASMPRAGAFLLRGDRLGAAAMRLHERFDGGGRDVRSDAFARWLGAEVDAGPIVPGLVGRVADGTTVRLAFFDGAPEDGGAELATLTFVAGEGDATAFQNEVRAAAEGASHVVVDVLGRVVALPEAAPADAAE